MMSVWMLFGRNVRRGIMRYEITNSTIDCKFIMVAVVSIAQGYQEEITGNWIGNNECG